MLRSARPLRSFTLPTCAMNIWDRDKDFPKHSWLQSTINILWKRATCIRVWKELYYRSRVATVVLDARQTQQEFIKKTSRHYPSSQGLQWAWSTQDGLKLDQSPRSDTFSLDWNSLYRWARIEVWIRTTSVIIPHLNHTWGFISSRYTPLQMASYDKKQFMLVSFLTFVSKILWKH